MLDDFNKRIIYPFAVIAVGVVSDLVDIVGVVASVVVAVVVKFVVGFVVVFGRTGIPSRGESFAGRRLSGPTFAARALLSDQFLLQFVRGVQL